MTTPEAKLSKDQLVRKIADLGKEEPWFHCIDLGHGIKTMTEPVQHLENLWHYIGKNIPEDLSGKRVLDMGCNAGFFSVKAKQRNADYVMGIDTSSGYLRQAQFVKDVLELDIHYRKLSIYELPKVDLKFDLVLCLGVIYHCADPFGAAKTVAAVCQDTAIVESALLSSKELSDRAIWEFVFPGYKSAAGASNETERHYNWWFPNMTGLKDLFEKAGFSRVTTMHEVGDRGSIICHKH